MEKNSQNTDTKNKQNIDLEEEMEKTLENNPNDYKNNIIKKLNNFEISLNNAYKENGEKKLKKRF